MDTGKPLTYTVYRGVWSIFHIALVGLLVVIGMVWYNTDHTGDRLVTEWWYTLWNVQYAIANAIPFPWGN